jgi:hypothetical protein
MPTVFVHKGVRYFFFSNEGNPREPVHIHVRKNEALAKFWLDPVRLEDSYGFDSRALREISDIIEERAEQIRRAWREHFG